MNFLSKQLFAVVFSLLLLLGMSVGVLATGTPAESSSSQVSPVSSEMSSSEETSSGELSSETVSSEESDVSSTLSEESSSMESIPSATVSTSSTASKNGTTSSRGQSGGNPIIYTSNGGSFYIEGGTGFAGGDENTEATNSTQSSSDKKDSDKKESKSITKLFFVFLWVPVVLVLASIIALIYVNRKGNSGNVSSGEDEFTNLNDLASRGKTKNTKRQDEKERHRRRTNIYRPRD